MTGRRLSERLGKVQFWILFVGTNLAFFPQHLLGLDGMVRRIADYSANAGWTELNFLSTVGAFLIAASVLPFLWNVFSTLRKPMEHEADPWDANALEWATTQPAAAVELRLAAGGAQRAARGSTRSTRAWVRRRRPSRRRPPRGAGLMTTSSDAMLPAVHEDLEVSGHDAAARRHGHRRCWG